MTSKSKTEERFFSPCPLQDANFCGLSVEVSDGVVTKVRPYDFPVRADRGACPNAIATPEMVYNKDRLRHPLKRVGKRGEGKWQRVSWDEALDSIADKLKELMQQYGSTSVGWVGHLDPIATLSDSGYSRLASLTKGSWIGFVGAGDAAGPGADMATGAGEMNLARIKDPKFSIIWGFNPEITWHHRMRRIKEDRKKGCHVVAIDPRSTITSSHVDEHIWIRPGTDGALALGMINIVLEQGLQDEAFIIANTVGPLLVRGDNGMFLRESDLVKDGSEKKFVVFDRNSDQPQPSDTAGVDPVLTGKYSVAGVECQPAFQLLKDMVQEYTTQIVSEITDIPVDVIRRLAISYATQKPASIHRGWGMQRSFHSDLSCRAINTLAAITGNMNLQRRTSFVMNWQAVTMHDGSRNPIPVLLLYDAITKGEPLPIKALWMAGRNFLNQLPDMKGTINEVLPNLELIVVCDLFMTATAKYADYVLPVTSFFENMDLRVLFTPGVVLTRSENIYLGLQQKLIEPLHECKSDFEIAAELGRRLGLAEYFNKTEEQSIEEVLASGHPSMEGITLEKLKEGPVLLKGEDSPPQFMTPTGRIEFYVERLKPFGHELPIYLEPAESTRGEAGREHPLSLITAHPRYRLHSSMAKVPSLRRMEPEPALDINPADAEARNIAQGDVVSVFNDRGQVKLKANLDPGIKPGVVNIDQGWWPEDYIDGHHNQLTHRRINPVQQMIFEPNTAYFDVSVEVQKVPEIDSLTKRLKKDSGEMRLRVWGGG